MTDVETAPQVLVADGVATVRLDGREQTFAIKELPEAFTKWQLEYKHRIYDSILKMSTSVSTRDTCRWSVRGTTSPSSRTWQTRRGFTPKDEYIEKYLQARRGCGRRDREAADTRRRRHAQDAHRHGPEFYAHPALDWSRLGLLEIFEAARTATSPASPSPRVVDRRFPCSSSYQVDCVVEVITPDHTALSVLVGDAAPLRVEPSTSSRRCSRTRTPCGLQTSRTDTAGRFK